MKLENYKLVKKNRCLVRKRGSSWQLESYSEKTPFDCVELDAGGYNTITYRIDELFDILCWNDELEKVLENLPETTSMTDDVVAMLEYVKNELGGWLPDDVAERHYERVKEESWLDRDSYI
jgi:hypothetical protein